MIKSAMERFRAGLSKTRSGLFARLQALFSGKVKLDKDTLDQIEELLISADMGVKSSLAITRNIERRLRQEGGEANLNSVLQVIRADVEDILTRATPRVHPPGWDDLSIEGGQKKQKKKKKKKKGKVRADAVAPVVDAVTAKQPRVIFVVGVNGSGKTTSIAKLAHLYKQEGQQVLLAAADTFRAAAVEQLQVWAERIDVECVAQGSGADPAAVVQG